MDICSFHLLFFCFNHVWKIKNQAARLWMRFCQVCPCTCVCTHHHLLSQGLCVARKACGATGRSITPKHNRKPVLRAKSNERLHKKKFQVSHNFYLPHIHIQKECLPAIGQLSNLWELQAVKDLETRALTDILAESATVLTFGNANCSISSLQLHL